MFYRHSLVTTNILSPQDQSFSYGCLPSGSSWDNSSSGWPWWRLVIMSMSGGSATSSVSVPKLPPLRRLVQNEVEAILEDEIVSTTDKGYRCYFVQWKGRPASDNSWLQEEELRDLASDVLDAYLHANSPEASFSKPERIDRNGQLKQYYKKCSKKIKS